MALKERYSVKDAARNLGKTPETILKYIRAGALKAKNIRPNSSRPCWQIFEEDLNAFGADNDNLAAPKKVNLTSASARRTPVSGLPSLEDVLAGKLAKRGAR